MRVTPSCLLRNWSPRPRAGQFVLRLAVRDQENRRAETAVLFEVIQQ
jgi:hypothetical protein